MNSIKSHIIVCLIGFILGLALMFQCNNPSREIRYVNYEKIDTVFYSVVIPPDTVRIVTKGKVIFEPVVKDSLIVQTDTINNLDYLLKDSLGFAPVYPAKLAGVNLWVSPPFVFSADTVIDGNKYKLGFKYPELIQELEVDKKPDTLMTREITKNIYVERTPAWHERWYVRVPINLAAFGLGVWAASK